MPSTEEVLRAIATDALDAEYFDEAQRLILKLRGGGSPTFLSPALRIALRVRCSSSICGNAVSATNQGGDVYRDVPRLLRKLNVQEEVAARVLWLLSEDATSTADPEKQALEDAMGLLFFSRKASDQELDAQAPHAPKINEEFQRVWKKLTRVAQALAVSFDYTPFVFGCLLESIAAVGPLQVTISPMVAPRLPPKTVALLRETWSAVPKEAFCSDFFERLYAEDKALSEVFACEVGRPSNVWKVVQLLLDLLDPEQVPRFELIVHSIAVLSHEYGGLRMRHLAPLKRALVRTVVAHAESEKKRVNRMWEAFFYAMAAVAAPHLTLSDSICEFSLATASSLPIPGGGTHAGAIAAHGISLLEMCLSVSALSQGGKRAPEGVIAKLCEARQWLIDLVRNDVNAYCGLLASVYGDPGPDEAGSSGADVGETERRRWQRWATEVPLRVAELAMGTAVRCLSYGKQVNPSLEGDWISGAKLMRTALEISLKNVNLNIRGASMGANDLELRLGRLTGTDPPWEDLCNFGR